MKTHSIVKECKSEGHIAQKRIAVLVEIRCSRCGGFEKRISYKEWKENEQLWLKEMIEE